MSLLVWYDYLLFLEAFFASITLLAANLFFVFGECLDFFIFLSPVGRFAIYEMNEDNTKMCFSISE